MNERQPNEPADPQLEWDQDGQYFHYLTKWMHALYCMGRETSERRYVCWAVELAATAHRSFTYEVSPGGSKRMVWKMSIDLQRPLVSSMGQHDPLDGLVTYLELQASEAAAENRAALAAPIADATKMCQGAHWLTDDPLGIGGLLDDAARLIQLVFARGMDRGQLLRRILAAALPSLRAFSRSSLVSRPADQRLAFRELGLSIGVWGLDQLSALVPRNHDLAPIVTDLLAYRPLAETIQAFWSDPAHRCSSTWMDHRDINTVMLATSIAPEGYFQFTSDECA